MKKWLVFILFISTFKSAFGSDDDVVKIIEPSSRSALWLNPGLYSYHFDRNRDFNAYNVGLGAEYQISTVTSITAGFYRNSYYQNSSYVGAYWQPIGVGPMKLGVVTGMFNGYSNTNNGGWFPAVLPALSVEGDLFGCNLLFIPTVPNRVAGSISLQFKMKVMD
jgi:hypothetical protein